MPDNITLVHDRIYISDGPTAGNIQLLQSLGINGVVNAALEFNHSYPPEIVCRRCGLHDEFPNCQENADDQLQEAIVSLARLYQEGTVLSHCAKGHNRSGAIVVGFLVWTGVYPNVFEAYGRIAAKRELHIQPRLLNHLDRLLYDFCMNGEHA